MMNLYELLVHKGFIDAVMFPFDYETWGIWWAMEEHGRIAFFEPEFCTGALKLTVDESTLDWEPRYIRAFQSTNTNDPYNNLEAEWANMMLFYFRVGEGKHLERLIKNYNEHAEKYEYESIFGSSSTGGTLVQTLAAYLVPPVN